jgi:hypothetical protein
LKSLYPYECHFFEEEVPNENSKYKLEGDLSLIPNKKLDTMPKALSIQFMDSVWCLLEESRKYWPCFKQYFVVIRDFALLGHHARKYYLSRNIFPIFNDWFMGSPKPGQRTRVLVMDAHHLPDLTEYIATLAIVLRGCENGAPKEKGYPPTTIFSEPGKVVLPLPEQENMMFEKIFFNSMLKMDYNRQAAIQIIQHASWENMPRTRWIIEHIVLVFTSSPEKVSLFKHLFTEMLSIQDSLQTQRIAYALSSSNRYGLLNSMKNIAARDAIALILVWLFLFIYLFIFFKCLF